VEWAHEELPPANQAKKMFDPTATIQPLGTPTEPAPDPLEHARYWYDGDGMMVKGQVNGTVTYYPGRHYNKEVKESAVTTKKFYAAAGQMVAVRSVQEAQDVLKWMLTDHLGSASVTANENGTWNSTIQYTAFGEVRAKNGVTPGDYRYTGQLEQAELGLYYYVARWYDPAIAHFAQADTIVPSPDNSEAYDRYAYVINNPIRNNDPSGHCYATTDGKNPTQKCVNRWSQYTQGVRSLIRPSSLPVAPPAPTTIIPLSGKKAVEKLLWGGTSGNVNAKGPEPASQLSIWSNWATTTVQYPGTKRGQAGNVPVETANESVVISIGYSGGADSQLIWVNEVLETLGKENIDIQAIVLLGPTFTGSFTSSENGPGLNDEWKRIFDELLMDGTNILVIDDNAAGGSEAEHYLAPEGAKGIFVYVYVDQEHYAMETIGVATNNNMEFRDSILYWIDHPAEPFGSH